MEEVAFVEDTIFSINNLGIGSKEAWKTGQRKLLVIQHRPGKILCLNWLEFNSFVGTVVLSERRTM